MAATVEGNVVLLSVRAGSYFDLNRVGTDIWNMLAEPRRVGQILDALAEAYEGDAVTMTRDVTAFLQRLIDERLVRIVDAERAR